MFIHSEQGRESGTQNRPPAPKGRQGHGHFSGSSRLPSTKTLDPHNLSIQQKPLQRLWSPAPSLSTWFLQIKHPCIAQLPMQTQRSTFSSADNSQRRFKSRFSGLYYLPASSFLPVEKEQRETRTAPRPCFLLVLALSAPGTPPMRHF